MIYPGIGSGICPRVLSGIPSQDPSGTHPGNSSWILPEARSGIEFIQRYSLEISPEV